MPFFPAVENARDYRPEYIARGCGQKMGNEPGTDDVTVCEDEDAPDKPAATIVLAAGSHAGHLEAAFQSLGAKYGWEVLVVTKSSCVFGLEKEPDQEMCGRWNENFIEWLDTREVDLVVTPATRLNRDEYVYDAAPAWWERITNTGVELLLVRGTPRGLEDVPDCLAAGGSVSECGPTTEFYAETNPLLSMDLPENAYSLDISRYVCPNLEHEGADNCDAIVGNILVWYDNHHFTTPFSASLAPAFEEEMTKVVPHYLR